MTTIPKMGIRKIGRRAALALLNAAAVTLPLALPRFGLAQEAVPAAGGTA